MTDIEIFDRSVFEYLSDITTALIYAPTDKALQTLLKNYEYKDKQPWGCLSFFRSPGFEIDHSRDHFSSTVFGQHTRLMQNDDGSREARYVKDLPVNFTYNVEIWAATSNKVQELATKLICKLHMKDQVLDVPMNPEGELGRFHMTNILWMDNSDLERENEYGRFYRHTITFTVEGRIKVVEDVKTTKFRCVPVDIYESL